MFLVVGFIRELIEILLRSFGGKITPKVIGDKSVALMDAHYLKLLFY